MTDKEKLDYLIEAMRNVAQAIDNETPDMALWEIRRAMKTIEEWDGNGADIAVAALLRVTRPCQPH